MLEFYHLPMFGPHICNVEFAIARAMDRFLPVSGKASFPISMPFGLGLPSVIVDSWRMRPMLHSDFSAFGRHDGITNSACARKARRGFPTLAINHRVFHCQTPMLSPTRHHRPLAGKVAVLPTG